MAEKLTFSAITALSLPKGENCQDPVRSDESQSLEQTKEINSGNDNDNHELEEKPLNVSQIRQKFEEKCRPKLVFVKLPPTTFGTQTTEEETKASSEFQKLYPNFRDYFTKRQFAAIETCFNLADINQDGFLDPKEVKQLMIDCQHPVNLCEAELIVSLGDNDEDGKLSAKEFLELCKPSAEILREQHHMEGSSMPSSNEDFAQTIIQKLRNMASPVNSRVQGTRQFFENIICSRTNLCNQMKIGCSARKKLSEKKYNAHRGENECEEPLLESSKPKISVLENGVVLVEETEEEHGSCNLRNQCC